MSAEERRSRFEDIRRLINEQKAEQQRAIEALARENRELREMILAYQERTETNIAWLKQRVIEHKESA